MAMSAGRVVVTTTPALFFKAGVEGAEIQIHHDDVNRTVYFGPPTVSTANGFHLDSTEKMDTISLDGDEEIWAVCDAQTTDTSYIAWVKHK